MANQETETKPIEIPSQPLSLERETAARFGTTIGQQQEAAPSQEEFFVARYKTKEEAARALEEKDRLIGEHGQKLGASALEIQRLKDENVRLLQGFSQPAAQKQEVVEEEPDYGDFYADPIGVLKKQGEYLEKKFAKTLKQELQEERKAQNTHDAMVADFVNNQKDLHPYENYVTMRRNQLQEQGIKDPLQAYQMAVRDVRLQLQQSQQYAAPVQNVQPQYQQYQQPQYAPQQPQYQPQQIPNLMPSQNAAMPPQLEISPSPRQYQEQTGNFRMELLKKRTDGQMGFRG